MKKVILTKTDHFENTIESPMLRKFVLDQIPDTEIINDIIAVNYSDEGYCVFDLMWEFEDVLCVEFIGTAC